MFWLRMVWVAIAAIPATTSSILGLAVPKYRLELESRPKKVGLGIAVKIRLVQVSDAVPVSGAAIVYTQFTATYKSGVVNVPTKVSVGPEPGVFIVETEPSIGDKWLLKIAVEVAESDLVEATFAMSVGG